MSSVWKSKSWIAASSDHLHRGRHTLLGIEKWIFREQSRYQEVAIAEVPDFGKALFLDSVVEFATADEFVYHEAFALPPLLFHDAPKRVLIEGGGDGLALREVLRDPRVEEVVVVELDGLVVDACREHMADMHGGSFDNPRAMILIDDALSYLDASPPKFDVVLVDLIDGYDAASIELYEKALPLTRNALAPGAIVGGFGDLQQPLLPVRFTYRGLDRHFAHLAMHRAAIESFSGAYGFLLASDDVDFHQIPTALIEERASNLTGVTRSLIPSFFPACFALPHYLEEALKEQPPPPPAALADSFSWVFPDV